MILGPIYAPWTFNFGQIFSCHHFISLCFEILTWFLVFGITMMSYISSLAFVPQKSEISISKQMTYTGADPGFQVRGGTLKKNCADEGRH
jgi:hypothetical protein